MHNQANNTIGYFLTFSPKFDSQFFCDSLVMARSFFGFRRKTTHTNFDLALSTELCKKKDKKDGSNMDSNVYSNASVL